jgi:hypothetical protein
MYNPSPPIIIEEQKSQHKKSGSRKFKNIDQLMKPESLMKIKNEMPNHSLSDGSSMQTNFHEAFFDEFNDVQK